MSYFSEVDAKKQAEHDFAWRGRKDRDMYDRYGRDDQRAYANEFDRLQRENERRQEERREEERREEEMVEQRREEQRQRNREYERQQEEEMYQEQAHQEAGDL